MNVTNHDAEKVAAELTHCDMSIGFDLKSKGELFCHFSLYKSPKKLFLNVLTESILESCNENIFCSKTTFLFLPAK